MENIRAFLKRKDVIISAHRYGIDAMGAMAQGLFASLLIGTIIKTLGQQTGIAFLVTAGGYADIFLSPLCNIYFVKKRVTFCRAEYNPPRTIFVEKAGQMRYNNRKFV